MSIHTSNYLQLPIAERIQLVEDIWDSIAEESSNSLLLSNEQKIELDKRLAEHQNDPDSAIPWNETRKKLHKRFMP